MHVSAVQLQAQELLGAAGAASAILLACLLRSFAGLAVPMPRRVGAGGAAGDPEQRGHESGMASLEKRSEKWVRAVLGYVASQRAESTHTTPGTSGDAGGALAQTVLEHTAPVLRTTLRGVAMEAGESSEPSLVTLGELCSAAGRNLREHLSRAGHPLEQVLREVLDSGR